MSAGPVNSPAAVSAPIEGVVVVCVGERFLLIRRAAHILAGGAWCCVGGSIETGESQDAAVVREFREEVGGHVRPVSKVWEYLRPDGRLRLHWWRAELLEGSLAANPAEVAEIRWCTIPEAFRLAELLPSNREFFEAIGGQIRWV